MPSWKVRIAVALGAIVVILLVGWLIPAGAADLEIVMVKIAPGSINDLTVTPGDVRTTDKHSICTTKTSTLRSVSSKVKKQAFKLYGLTNKTGWCKAKGCEVDHLISLELGGTNDIKNLWPQSYAGKWNARVKDKLENRLHKLICNGTVSPEDAQFAISHDWIGAYEKYLSP